jgi:hypothetical protein
MIRVIEQRPFIQNFCDFVGKFLVTEPATVGEVELVEANARLLISRIEGLKEKQFPMENTCSTTL